MAHPVRFLVVAASSLAVVYAALLQADSSSLLSFTEVADPSGIHATMRNGGPEKRWIPEANGSGAAWLDYDNDGKMDLLIVNGGSMEQLRQIVAGVVPPPPEGGVYLFHNLGNGKFEDVTKRAGLVNPYWGTGANTADFNNDGFADILITTIGRDLLYRNNGNGTFSDVSAAAGLAQDIAWHTGSAFGDFHGDGKLDLFVTGYSDIHALSLSEPPPVCDYQGQHVFCGPIGLKGGHSVFYRNAGGGKFVDATKDSGISAAAPAHGFSAITGDFNQDGKLDLLVSNDSDPNYLFLNHGNGMFKEAALETGVAFNADGRTQSNMGIAVGEYARSGRQDIFVTTFQRDYFPLFRPDQSGVYEDIASSLGLVNATTKYLGWACGFADFSNEGMQDLWMANGHVYPTDKDYWEPITILHDAGGKATLRFSYPAKPNASYRGGAVADFDNDGRLNLLVLPIAGSPVLLRNITTNSNSWIGFDLIGVRSNRDAIGARVTVEACGVKQSEEVRNGGSYLSHNDPRLHFGLGSCQKIDRVIARWPTGFLQTVPNPSINRYAKIVESK